MSGWHELAPVTIVTAFVCGMQPALLGGIRLPLSQRLAVDESRATALPAAFNLVLIPLMLIGGLLVDYVGVRETLIIGSLLAALGTFALATSRSYALALYAVGALAAGAASLNTAAVVLMPNAFFDDNEPASLNLGFAFIGSGALIAPALVELLARRLGFRQALSLLAVACLAPALLTMWKSAVVFPSPPPADAGAVLNHSVLWLAALALVLYAPLEGALGTWAGSYLAEQGHPRPRAAWLLSGFWLAFVAARLLTAWLQQQGVLPMDGGPWLLVLLGLATAVALGHLAGTHSRTAAAVGLLAVGALCGPILPTLVGSLFRHVAAHRGTAYGAMYALGSTGSLLLPPVIGVYARKTSVRAGLRIPTGIAVLLAGVALLLALW